MPTTHDDETPRPASARDQPDGVAARSAEQPRPVLGVIRLLARAVLVYIVVVEVLLAIGFVCLLFGIEPASWFVDVVYRSVERTMAPFRGLFSAIQFGTGSTEEVSPTIESSIPFAMIVYGIVGLAAHDLAEWIGRRQPR